MTVLALSAVAMIFMPGLVWLMASGFAGDERFDLAVEYGRITFPYILLISMASMISGVLNANGRFTAAAAAPVLLNLLFIVAMGLGRWQGWDLGLTLPGPRPSTGSRSWRWLVGRAADRIHVLAAPPAPDARHARLIAVALPAAFAGRRRADQPAGWPPGRNPGSRRDRLAVLFRPAVSVPLGVCGAAVAVVLLPELARRIRPRITRGRPVGLFPRHGIRDCS